MAQGLDLLFDLLLAVGFAAPHSLLLRQGGRRLVERALPRPLFPTLYGLSASVTLLAVCWLWRPVPALLWSLDGGARGAMLAAHSGGWGLMLWSLVHYGAFRQPGIEQWWRFIRGREPAPYALPTTGPFAYTRHPIYIAMAVLIWTTPWMTASHLLLAVTWTVYLALGVLHKEVRLRRTIGRAYIEYASRIPAIPFVRVGRGMTVRG